MVEFSAGTLTLSAYQKAANKTDNLFRTNRHLSFPLLGIFGEAGSILSEVKKKQRDRAAYIGYQKTVVEEFGDTLWYLSAIACRSNVSLAYVGHNIDRPVDDWQFSAPEDLKFVDLQKPIGRKASEPSSQFEQVAPCNVVHRAHHQSHINRCGRREFVLMRGYGHQMPASLLDPSSSALWSKWSLRNSKTSSGLIALPEGLPPSSV